VGKLDSRSVVVGATRTCGGSYGCWGCEDDEAVVWEPDGRMQLDVVDSPEELEALLDEKRRRGTGPGCQPGSVGAGRIAKPGEPLPADVKIGD